MGVDTDTGPEAPALSQLHSGIGHADELDKTGKHDAHVILHMTIVDHDHSIQDAWFRTHTPRDRAEKFATIRSCVERMLLYANLQERFPEYVRS